MEGGRRQQNNSALEMTPFIVTVRTMTDFFNAFLLVYAGLFPIINPIGNAPIFLGLTSSCTEAERNTLAHRVAINSFLLLAGSMFIGSHLLVFFGITLPVVRVAGGLVLIAFGWKLLHSGAEVEDQRLAGAKGRPATDDSFYPLTMPLTVGPGSISVAVALGSQRPAGPLEMSAAGAARRFGDCRDRRSLCHDLYLLPFRQAHHCPVGR
jgi:multiple antibiotic resistance protein